MLTHTEHSPHPLTLSPSPPLTLHPFHSPPLTVHSLPQSQPRPRAALPPAKTGASDPRSPAMCYLSTGLRVADA
eukprot:73954-Rhodomonas_salina.1